MSWEDHIGETYDFMTAPLPLAMLLAFLTALVRTLRKLKAWRWSSVVSCLLEAAACALLSLMLYEAGILWLGLPETWAQFVGVFTGWLGTDGVTRAMKAGLDILIARFDANPAPAKSTKPENK